MFSSDYSVQARKIITIVILALSIAYTSYNQRMFILMQPSLKDFYSVEEYIAPNSKIMSINFIPYITPIKKGDMRSQLHFPLTNTTTLVSTYRNSIDFFNYETIEKNVFPLILFDDTLLNNATANTLRRLDYYNSIASKPSYIRKVFGAYPDYILAWYRDDLIRDTKVTQTKNSFLKDIEKDYKLIFTSKLKLMHLYKRK
jgi:hypothetical protein